MVAVPGVDGVHAPGLVGEEGEVAPVGEELLLALLGVQWTRRTTSRRPSWVVSASSQTPVSG